MTELYASHTRGEALQLCGLPVQDQDWVCRGGRAALFAEVGQAEDAPHFPDATRFHWVGDLPPEAAREGIYLWARVPEAADSYLYMGRLAQPYMCEPKGDGSGYRQVIYELPALLPSAVWHRLAGIWIPPKGAIDEAAERFRAASDPAGRFSAFTLLAQAWYGQVEVGERPERELPLALRWFYEFAGGTPCLMERAFYRTPASTALEVWNGWIFFCLESQGVENYAIAEADLEATDPEVFVCSDATENELISMGTTLTTFFVWDFLRSITGYAPYMRSEQLTESERARFERHMPKLEVPSHILLCAGVPCTYHIAGDVVARIDQYSGRWEGHFVARTESSINELWEQVLE